MSNRNTDNFDLGDFDNFDEPTFAGSGFTDEIDLTPSEVITTQGGRNTRFVVLATVLVLLILLGAVGIILLAIDQGRKQSEFAGTAAAIYATNTQVAIFNFQTQTAAAWTDTPTYTPTPTDTPTPTETPTSTPTETPDIDATNTAVALTEQALMLTEGPANATLTEVARQLTSFVQTQTAAANALTQTALAPTLTPTASNTLPPGITPSVTPIAPQIVTATPGAADGTPASINVNLTLVFPTQGPIVIVTNTPIPTLNRDQKTQTRAAQMTATSLGTPVDAIPDTGFFDDVVLANAGSMGMTMVTISALGLVAVIVAARRLRVRV
jgi:hypothetical protein